MSFLKESVKHTLFYVFYACLGSKNLVKFWLTCVRWEPSFNDFWKPILFYIFLQFNEALYISRSATRILLRKGFVGLNGKFLDVVLMTYFRWR